LTFLRADRPTLAQKAILKICNQPDMHMDLMWQTSQNLKRWVIWSERCLPAAFAQQGWGNLHGQLVE
jgi:hypothetical protein